VDLEPGDFCREIEAYLCRKNDGHIVRIVGPAFEQVCGWAAKGVPFKVACRGIDRYFERYYAKGPRRRPVRVEFCDADVLDVFDEWRRAVGVAASPDVEEAGHPSRHGSLPAHLERVVARLTTLRAGEVRSLDAIIDELIRELDAARSRAKGLRGDARQAFVERLRDLDDHLINVAREGCSAETLQELRVEADRELLPFRARMPEEAYAQSRNACVNRLVRERLRLPVVAFE
jgi:hypothetical protein